MSFSKEQIAELLKKWSKVLDQMGQMSSYTKEVTAIILENTANGNGRIEKVPGGWLDSNGTFRASED